MCLINHTLIVASEDQLEFQIDASTDMLLFALHRRSGLVEQHLDAIARQLTVDGRNKRIQILCSHRSTGEVEFSLEIALLRWN